jgi:methylenetetrahydrofolate dehydrogenase (NADP+)/methenyltetrahydrofolate cyclohydrolase
MSAKIIDGKAAAREIKEQLSAEAAALRQAGNPVRLVAVQVGHDDASKYYTNMQARQAQATGIDYELVELPESSSQTDVIGHILKLNADKTISGLILQMPLPKHINAAAAQLAISPDKDVEGMHPENLGRLLTGAGLVAPCTPMAAMELLRRACPDLSGKRAVVVGRSTIVGKPIAMMLLQMDVSATVTVCHSRTKDLAGQTRQAEVLIAATGLSQSNWNRYQQQKSAGKAVARPDLAPLISADMVAEGAVVIDVATNYIPAGFDEAGEPLKDDKGEIALKSVGDVDFEGVMERASAITPVPGGVGPVTVAMLLKNTIACAKAAR